jgi:acetyl-CoA C-acetyltransferase
MTTAPVTGSVGMVLASPGFIRQRRLADLAWVRGIGWATEPSFLGDRNLSRLPNVLRQVSGPEFAVRHA